MLKTKQTEFQFIAIKLQDSSDSDNDFEQLKSTPLIEQFSFLDRPRGKYMYT